MRVPALIAAAVAAGTLMAEPASAQTITVQNHDFEQGVVLAENGFSTETPGWTWSGGNSGAGRWNPSEARLPDQDDHGTVVWANGPIGTSPSSGFFAQVVDGLIIQANTTYTLTVDVATATDVPNWGYDFGLLAGTADSIFASKLVELSGTTDAKGDAIPLGYFSTLTLTYQTGDTGEEIGKSLIIALGGLGNGSAYDNVTLRATSLAAPVPEPTTWAMMLFGFGAAGAALRRQRRPMAQAA